jgi:hypothetical protein
MQYLSLLAGVKRVTDTPEDLARLGCEPAVDSRDPLA